MMQAESKEAGKLVRLKLDVRDGIVVDAKIVGDFFMHPEDSIQDLEQLLTGRATHDGIHNEVQQYVDENNIQLIGITAQVLEQLTQKILDQND